MYCKHQRLQAPNQQEIREIMLTHLHVWLPSLLLQAFTVTHAVTQLAKHMLCKEDRHGMHSRRGWRETDSLHPLTSHTYTGDCGLKHRFPQNLCINVSLMILDGRWWWWCVSASLPHDVHHDEGKENRKEKCCTHTHSGMNWVGHRERETHSLVTHCAEGETCRWKSGYRMKENTRKGALIAVSRFSAEIWGERNRWFTHSLFTWVNKWFWCCKKEREKWYLLLLFPLFPQHSNIRSACSSPCSVPGPTASSHMLLSDIELEVSCCYCNNWHEYSVYFQYSISTQRVMTHDSLVGELHRLSGIKCFTYSETRITGSLSFLRFCGKQHKRYDETKQEVKQERVTKFYSHWIYVSDSLRNEKIRSADSRIVILWTSFTLCRSPLVSWGSKFASVTPFNVRLTRDFETQRRTKNASSISS